MLASKSLAPEYGPQLLGGGGGGRGGGGGGGERVVVVVVLFCTGEDMVCWERDEQVIGLVGTLYIG